jgi:hypothetical protein
MRQNQVGLRVCYVKCDSVVEILSISLYTSCVEVIVVNVYRHLQNVFDVDYCETA